MLFFVSHPLALDITRHKLQRQHDAVLYDKPIFPNFPHREPPAVAAIILATPSALLGLSSNAFLIGLAYTSGV
jgi:hypothetical protein